MKMNVLKNQRGVALVTAIMISAALLVTALGVLYFIDQATGMSGAGRRYATAEEVSDGAVNVVKDSINLVMWGEQVPEGVFSEADRTCMTNAIIGAVASCQAVVPLPDAVGGDFTAQVLVQRLYSNSLPGGRLEFARGAGGAPSTAVYYRITTTVRNATNNNILTESAILYRFSG